MRSEKLLFLRRYFANPSAVGSVIPSSKYLAQGMFNVANVLPKTDNVVEIGAGTGAVSEYLQSCNPTLVELDAGFCDFLKTRFPKSTVVEGCAVEYLKSLKDEIGLVISLPLINNPIKNSLVKQMRQSYNEGKIKWCVTYTYGFYSPLKEVGFDTGKRTKLILKNVPPASVWSYY